MDRQYTEQSRARQVSRANRRPPTPTQRYGCDVVHSTTAHDRPPKKGKNVRRHAMPSGIESAQSNATGRTQTDRERQTNEEARTKAAMHLCPVRQMAGPSSV
mmetsp:Transcript_18215/g.51852  ORF Transcript_18215/g.51852 Transcript_18215/m.51852 type:complete len:102 (+) Transcript_18215:640-945(+)